MELVEGALSLGTAVRHTLMAEATGLSGLDNPNSVAQLTQWLQEETGEELPDLRKDTVAQLLQKDENSPAVRRMLEIRQALGKTSTLALLAQGVLRVSFFDALQGDPEHLGGAGLVDFAMGAEHLQPPLLTSQPGDDTGLDGRKVSVNEDVALRGDESGADELQALGKTSTKKYNAIQAAVCADGRVRGLLQFYGANRTGRWAGPPGCPCPGPPS